MEWLTNPEIWVSLLTLTVLEIVLGIDNIVFISIMANKMPVHQQKKTRRLGLMMALVTRILLLMSISWIMSLKAPLFNLGELIGIHSGEWHEKLEISGRDIILIIGGLFLIYKSVTEIHERIEGGHGEEIRKKKPASLTSVVFQIMLLDIVFSLDSVITAVGMANHIEVMVAAVIIAVGIMLMASESISRFVNNHPTVKMLALSFLLLIGVSLIAEGFEQAIPKGYIYFSMAFSVLVETLNLRAGKKSAKEEHH